MTKRVSLTDDLLQEGLQYLDEANSQWVSFRKLSDFNRATKNPRSSELIRGSKFSDYPQALKRIFYKVYGRFENITSTWSDEELHKEIRMPLVEAMVGRSSSRLFGTKSLPLKCLWSLLSLCAGRRASDPNRRYYPSAGGRYPLELYLFVRDCEGLRPGAYHYNVKSGALERLEFVPEDVDVGRFLVREELSQAQVLLVITSVFERNFIKYGLRGYRHALIEAGHFGQNICLVSTALGLCCVPLAGYSDRDVDETLGLDGDRESVLYMFALGTR